MMKSEPKNCLLAPNIYLFAYHLKEEKSPFLQDGNKLLEKFTAKTLNVDDASSDRLLLKEEKSISFTFSDSPKIEGFAQPWQIKDSYSLFFNIGYDDKEEPLEKIDFETLKKLKPQGVLRLSEREKFLGQTLLITGYLPTLNKQRDAKYLHELANNCYEALFDDNDPPLSRSGELFGSSIFEYGNKTDNCQVLIWLFRDEKAHNLVNNCLNNLCDLLFYRAKIVKAFGDSRSVYKGLDRKYSQIETSLDTLQGKLDKHCDTTTSDSYLEDFKTQLKYLAQESLTYTRFLRKMEDLNTTIEINLFNYNETIDRISEKLGIEKKELSFLQYFGTETAPHFHRQIQADLGYFQHGTDLISQAIASIRGVVEIDQAQRNEALEDQIQAVGVGIATGAIIASTSGLITQPWSLPSRDRPLPHPFILALVASVVCSWGMWWIAKKLIQKRRSPEN